MSAFDARRLPEPRLTFSKDVPSHSGPNAWNGLNLYGPFDNSRVDLPAKSLLFVFPNELKHLAHKLAAGLKGHKRFRGFQQMFRVPFDGSKMDFLTFKADLSSGAAAAASYREEIVRWSEASRTSDPLAAVVLVPKSDRWETERPYYVAKAGVIALVEGLLQRLDELTARVTELERQVKRNSRNSSQPLPWNRNWSRVVYRASGARCRKRRRMRGFVRRARRPCVWSRQAQAGISRITSEPGRH